MRFLAVLLLCLVPLSSVEAKPSPYRADTFSGDRYVARVAEPQARPVVRHSRHAKVRYLYRTKARHKGAPLPRRRPGMVAPLTMAAGFTREVRQAFHGPRPRAWCGWWLSHHLGMPRRDLWLARNWAGVGSNAGGPQVGAVVVWRHHVGIITGRAGNKWVVKSGNDGRRVRERPRSVAGAIAFRRV